MKSINCSHTTVLATAPTTAPTPAPTTAPAPGNCELPDWYGDDYCDDENNNADCGFDGGDCCNNGFKDWKKYCTECKCKK